MGQQQVLKFQGGGKSSNRAYDFSFHTQATHAHTASDEAATGRPTDLQERQGSPDTPEPG